MVLVRDQDAEKVVESIQKTAQVGKIIITNIDTVIDIKSNKKGEQGL